MRVPWRNFVRRGDVSKTHLSYGCTMPADTRVRVRALLEKQIVFVMATSQEYGPELRARIDPLICGVGPIEASLTMASRLQQMRDRGESPAVVVSLGSAGSQMCELGTVYQVSEVSWRDIDATRLGFPKGVTPFVDRPACIPLPTPLAGIPTATLSTWKRPRSFEPPGGIGDLNP